MKKRVLSFLLAIVLMVVLLPPVSVRAAEKMNGLIRVVDLGFNRSAAIDADGCLWIWGLFEPERLNKPMKIMHNVKSVCAGSSFSAVVKTDGSLWTWGYNTWGQLGDGTTEDRLNPTKIMEDVAVVSLGWHHGALIKTDGSLWTWGNNEGYQIGDGTNEERHTPVKIMDDVAKISMGSHCGAAIKTDGSLWVWGNCYLGDGTTGERSAPVKIMDNVSAVDLGYNNGALIKTDGSLWAWGMNLRGEVGDGTAHERLAPVKIMDDVAAVSFGDIHSAAIKTDGSLWLWGYNTAGQIGDGTTQQRLTPVKIMEDVAEVSLGSDHSAAIKADGSLWMWGDNIDGEIGKGSTGGKYQDPVCISKGSSTAPCYCIRSMESEFGELSLNRGGVATAYFLVTDEDGDPASGVRFLVRLYVKGVKKREESVISDGNGLLAVDTPPINVTTTFQVTLDPWGGVPVYDGEQEFTVQVKKLSYSQSWSGELKVGGKVSVGIDAGGEIAVAGAEASLIEAEANMSRGGKISIVDEHDDGKRNLTLSLERREKLGVALKTGIDANMFGDLAKITFVGAGPGVTLSNTHSLGLKIVNYDPNDMEQLKDIGLFLISATFLTANSLYATWILDRLSPQICNQRGTSSGVTASDKVSVGGFKVKKGPIQKPVTIAGTACIEVLKYETEVDYLDKTLTMTASEVSEISYGALNQKYVGGYVAGKSSSNHREVSVVLEDPDSTSPSISSFSYKAYDGDESTWVLGSASKDVYSKVTYSGEAAAELAGKYPLLSEFADGDIIIDVQDAIDMMSDSGLTASFVETSKIKTGIDIDIPISLKAIVGGGISLGVVGESAVSYEDAAGVHYRDDIYWTSRSIARDEELESVTITLSRFVRNAVNTVLGWIEDMIISTRDCLINGLSNELFTLQGSVSDWWASVSIVGTGGAKSYGVLTLKSVKEPDSNAAVSATVGEPYLVTIYTDESCTEAVSDEALAAQPVTLTLGYTTELLAAAGAEPGAQVILLRFDKERDLYLPIEAAVQDDSTMTVSAQITQNGEYILAVDTIAPIVTDFTAKNATSTPELFALVSDLSGLSEFRFWVDNGEDLVTTENLNEYYDPSTGVFTYAVQSPLDEGTHTAYFLTADNLGNDNPAPVAFEFEVHTMQGSLGTPEASVAVVTKDEPFTVTVTASEDNEFTGITLQREIDGYGTESVVMERSGNIWTAEVQPIPGAERMRFTAIAGDDYGNTLRSEAVEVEIALPAPLNELTISELRLYPTENASAAEVTIIAPEGMAGSGIMVAVAYDADGRMLAMGSLPVGLRSGDELTVSIPIAVSTNVAACVKAFFLDPNGYIPLCAAFAR